MLLIALNYFICADMPLTTDSLTIVIIDSRQVELIRVEEIFIYFLHTVESKVVFFKAKHLMECEP